MTDTTPPPVVHDAPPRPDFEVLAGNALGNSPRGLPGGFGSPEPTEEQLEWLAGALESAFIRGERFCAQNGGRASQ